ncbi:hypothetical protein DYB32_008650 [Aphanomyces invadans]|uniref:Reverse transcriptase domain-containing protein n=1 Tax=Aphanomyces invadans TaxID=157072 RepID=A0A3R7A407_9STRA|nr:hypothetical protein DYB32_008650 [Aphanomyces invadans]
MLRAAPELGIPMPDGTSMTSVFFADDATLLSNSLESADHQVATIVATFCAASGAALNIKKCTTLVLNSNEPPVGRASAPSITLADTGVPIRYLGIYVGHNLDPAYQVQLINDRYLQAFAKWSCRARTIQGRKALASAVILSLIWHVTAVTAVPSAMIATWQRVLSNYVLGSKTSDDPKYRPLAARVWHHDKVLGLGIPHIASCIRTQRLLLLQKLMLPYTDDVHYYLPSRAQAAYNPASMSIPTDLAKPTHAATTTSVVSRVAFQLPDLVSSAAPATARPRTPAFAAARARADAAREPSPPRAPPAPGAPGVPAHDGDDVWSFQREQRRQADAIRSKSDIGYHRPTMAELQPVLDLLATGSASGGELFDAFEPLRRDSNRAIVGYVRIPTGAFTAQIDEDKALKAVLFDNHQANVGSSLAELIQLRKDLANQQLVLGLASFRAIDALTGVSFKLPVKDGQQTFLVESAHAMDGFHVDILDFAHDRAAERHLWCILAAWGAPPIAGAYTQVSALQSAKTSRYRLTFATADAPSLFRSNGRLIDEIILLGRIRNDGSLVPGGAGLLRLSLCRRPWLHQLGPRYIQNGEADWIQVILRPIPSSLVANYSLLRPPTPSNSSN